MDSYKVARQSILKEKDLADFTGGASFELIRAAEDKIGLKFTGAYLDYLKTFGAGNFGAQEIYGILNDEFENSSVPDAIWFTLTDRRESNLPANLLAIYDTGSDELFCLDFNQLDSIGEPKVVSFIPGVALDSQTYETIAESFGEFLLKMINEEI
ncbi:SMI1/KNR4 family protein [Alkalihalophilus marmarensis]|uniref:SMI1/KNR4 family protein n=1 Tax=Alkalihalophilus marmarensis TaxID=521377 RepID=UPI002DB74E77|nr:SMI1/KNR4 family protein [Alkalihalophilus marmarensis]MEC2072506.1 SMI1/KNR4 family protein [Alkalihalophilus marmarensis]